MVNPRRFPDSPTLDIDALYRAGALFTGQISAGPATGSR
jgi:hypothetical protein